MAMTRRAAVAGSWYPGTADALAREVDACLQAADARTTAEGPPPPAHVRALVAPHAGLVYSGPVAAFAYRQLRGRTYDVAVLVGPSHFVDFEGAAVTLVDAFATPLGPVTVDRACTEALLAASPLVRDLTAPHAREHCLEMQLPFLIRVLPGVPIVPIVIGRQTAATSRALAAALARVCAGRQALLIASTDLSHYHDAATANALDREVIDRVARFAIDDLQQLFDEQPGHACGSGALTAVMRAASQLGARTADVMCYADSGDVSGDKSAVVGYMAAVLGEPA